MNIKKEAYNKCKLIVEKELSSVQDKLRTNKRTINRISDEQRILKKEIGELYKMLHCLNTKQK